MDGSSNKQPIKESALELAVNQWFDLVLATIEHRKVKNGMRMRKYGKRKTR